MKNILKLLALSLFLFALPANAQDTCPPVPAHCVAFAWTQGAQPAGETLANTQIFRNGSLLAIVGPSILSYTDATVAPGTYNYYLINVDTNGIASPASLAISAVVPGNPPPPPPPPPPVQYSFDIAPTSLAFSGTVGSTNPAAQTILVGDTGPSGYHVTFSANPDSPWLGVTSSSTQTAATLTVSVNIAGLAASSQTGHIIVTGGTTDSPRSIPVTLTLKAGATPSMTTTCAWLSDNVTWRCNTKVTNFVKGQAIKSVVTSGTLANTTNSVKP